MEKRFNEVEIIDNKVVESGYLTGVEVSLKPYQVGMWLDFVRNRDKVFYSESDHSTLVGVGCDRSRVIAIYRSLTTYYAFVSDSIWYRSKKFRSELLADDLVAYEDNAELKVTPSQWKLVGDSSPDQDQPEYTTWGLSFEDAMHFAGVCPHCVAREVSPLEANLKEALECVPSEVRLWWEEDSCEVDRAPIYNRETVLSNEDSFSVLNLMEAVIKAYMEVQAKNMFHDSWDRWTRREGDTYRKPKVERPKTARRAPDAE